MEILSDAGKFYKIFENCIMRKFYELVWNLDAAAWFLLHNILHALKKFAWKKLFHYQCHLKFSHVFN